ncbi:protoporphyrinogen oxidase-like [Lytechinus pictus]|uniref:protoporphyrinogen oxidase-like n=1 Tax=Lytechinus pictus TaxID=7653 RepID=UPI0030B9F589
MATKQAGTVVLGGGISGLAAAFYSRVSQIGENKLVHPHGQEKIVILEGSPRVGGWVDSFQSPEGAVHERGTRSIRPVGVVGKNTLDLVSAIGLEDAVIPVTRSHPATQNRFIYTQDGLHRLPSSLTTVLQRQAPFSQSLLSRLIREPFAVKCKEEDETIHDFFSRRLGKEVAKYLANPFCRGIFAGDSKELSMRACFPAIFNAERKYGSIIIGGLRDKPEKFPDIGRSSIAQKAKEEKWATWTMTNGLETLPNRLSDWLIENGVEVQRSNPCRRIEFIQQTDARDTQKSVRLLTENGDVWEADHVVCATSAQVTQRLLPPEHEKLSNLLRQITSCTVAVVNLEYDNVQLPVTGFGYLVPSSVQSRVLGVIFDSCAFPELDRRKDPTTRMTCMMGGAWFNDLFGDPYNVDPSDLLSSALTTVHDHLGIGQKPTFSKVNIHHDCIPQYRLGHTQLVEDALSYIKDHHLPLSIIGSSYKGVSVNDCIFQARQAIHSLQK